MEPQTVNTSPVVLEVSKALHHKRNGLNLPELAALCDPFLSKSTFPNESEEEILLRRNRAMPQRKPEDLAVSHALCDASIASHGKAVSLMRSFGLEYPSEQHQRRSKITTSGMGWSFSSGSVNGTWKDGDLCHGNNDKQYEGQRDTIDVDEIFDIIRNIQDPEHPLTLEQLGVVSREQISVHDRVEGGPYSTLDIRYTPTIPHCSMATQIGLCLVVKLTRSLPAFKATVRIEPGTHASENAINKQLADKERVSAALENKHLLAIVNKCIINGMTGEMVT